MATNPGIPTGRHLQAVPDAPDADEIHDTDHIADPEDEAERAQQLEHSRQLLEEFSKVERVSASERAEQERVALQEQIAKAEATGLSAKEAAAAARAAAKAAKAAAIAINPPKPQTPTAFAWEGRPWGPLLIANDKGIPKPLLANAITALSFDPEWKDVLAHDIFAASTCATAQPPIETPIGPWSDVHDIRSNEWLQRVGISVSLGVTAQAVEAVARNRQYHPVKLYLEECAGKWDGIQRAEHWLVDYCECRDEPYTRAIAQIFLIGAVARIYQPGCKLDTALILEGPQGKGKSWVFERLFTPWFTDDMGDLGSKDSSMQVAGVWCVELAELSQMNRSEIEPIKAFITRRIDRFRPPYGHRVVERARQSVFAGTVNNSSYLKDDENRRFLPIKVGEWVNLEGLSAVRDQLWGEAVALYRAGAKWWMTDVALLDAAREQQAARRQADPWEGVIQTWISDRVAVMADVTYLSIEGLLTEAIGIKTDRMDQTQTNRIVRILALLGYVKCRPRINGERVNRYRLLKPGEALAADEK